MARAKDLFVEVAWKCAATGCEQVHRLGFMTYVDAPFEIEQPTGWTFAGGRAYCFKHTVELVVSPRGAQVIEFPLRDLQL